MPWGVAAAAVVGAYSQSEAQKDASEAHKQASDEARFAADIAKSQAKGDLNRLYRQAQESSTMGAQGAIDVLGQSVPQQIRSFQQGNIGAQQALLSGLPQIHNAILGGNINYGAFQPFSIQGLDTGFLTQEVPGLKEMYESRAGDAILNQLKSGAGAPDSLASSYGRVIDAIRSPLTPVESGSNPAVQVTPNVDVNRQQAYDDVRGKIASILAGRL